MLEFRNVTLPIGNGQALSGLSFVAPEGRVTCITGPGGDAVLRAVMGLQAVTEGYVSIDGEPVSPRSAPALRRLTAYVPRHLDAIGHFPTYDAPTPADLLTLKANRDKQGEDGLLDVALLLDKPIMLVAHASATPEWLRQAANLGKVVVVASDAGSVVAAADNTVRT